MFAQYCVAVNGPRDLVVIGIPGLGGRCSGPCLLLPRGSEVLAQYRVAVNGPRDLVVVGAHLAFR
jgi:hypothetical protein